MAFHNNLPVLQWRKVVLMLLFDLFYNVVEETEQAAENVSSALFSALREKWKNRHVDQEGEEEEEEQEWMKKRVKNEYCLQLSDLFNRGEKLWWGDVMVTSDKRRQWLVCKGLKHLLTKNTLSVIEYVRCFVP